MSRVAAERESLMASSDDEVERLFVASGTEEQAKARLMAEIEEKGRFFSMRGAEADFGYWSKVEFWTLDESIALLLGKAPEVVTWKAIQPYVNISAFAKQYERMRTLALRAQAMNRGQTAIYPSAVIGWANEMDIPVPKVLAQGLAQLSEKRHRSASEAAARKASVEQGQQQPAHLSPESPHSNAAAERETDCSDPQPIAAAPAVPAPVQRQVSQNAAILALIVELGYTPSALPRTPKGKESQAKQATKTAALNMPGFTEAVFNKAWQRLRSDGLICDE